SVRDRRGSRCPPEGALPYRPLSCPPSGLVGGVRQERRVARALDRRREHPLVRRARPRDSARNDLAALRDERSEKLHVLVVDVVDLLGTEPTDPATADEPALTTSSCGSHLARLLFAFGLVLGRFGKHLGRGGLGALASSAATGRRAGRSLRLELLGALEVLVDTARWCWRRSCSSSVP